MIGYLLGCVTVGLLWFFWPRIKPYVTNEEAKLDDDVKSEVDKLKGKL